VAAGLLLVILPCIGRHVLHALTAAFVRLESGVLAGSFAAVIILLGAPMILLGCVTPFAVRLAAQDVAETGRTAGQLFAWSTVGSFVGSFLPVLVLIPSIGTRNTFVLFGSLLILISIPGYLVSRAGCAAIISSLLLPAAAAAGLFGAKGQIKEYQHGKLLFEGESAY
jgi:predicted membrane-bound spermidine synthase